MKTFKILQILLLMSALFCQNLIAQTNYTPATPCVERGYNPNFDWTQDYFDFYLVGNSWGVGGYRHNKAPWIDWQNNSNLSAFQHNGRVEYGPEYDFGVAGNTINHPYLILYNKWKGVMRIFTAITAVAGPHNAAIIKLEYPITTPYKSAVLEFSSGKDYSAALSEFDNQVKTIKVPNNYTFDLPYWLYADFAVAYDPCTCNYNSNYNSNLLFDVQLITNSNLSFKLNGQLVQDLNANGQGGGGRQNLGSLYNGAFAAGKSYYETADKPINIIKAAVGEDALTPFLKNFVPGMAHALGIVSFAIGAFSESDPTPPLVFDANLKAQGNISTNYSHREVITDVPGTVPAGRPSIIPQYDNVLGVYNVLEKPNFGINLISTNFVTSIMEQKLMDNIKYVLNPRAEIDLDKFDIYGSIEIQTLPATTPGYSFGNIESLSPNFYKVTKLAGETQADSTEIWRSTTYPLAALKNVVIKYKIHNTLQTRSFVRLTMKHKRIIKTQPDPLEEININRYLATINYANNNLFNPPNKAELQAMKDIDEVAAIFTIPSGTTQILYAAHSLRIRHIYITGGGILRIMTGTSSDTNDNFPNVSFMYPSDFYQFQNQIEFAVGVPDIINEKLLPVNDSQKEKPITTFCNNNIYISRAKNFEANKDEDLSTSVVASSAPKSDNLSIYPNPTATDAAFSYTIAKAGATKITVTNMLGIVVSELVHAENHQIGSFEVNLNTQNLPSGIYLCVLQTVEGIQTKKLIINK